MASHHRLPHHRDESDRHACLIATTTLLLLFLPLGLAYFFLSPFPWQITTVLKAIALPEMLLVYWLTPATIRGVRFVVRNHLRDCLLIVLLEVPLNIATAHWPHRRTLALGAIADEVAKALDRGRLVLGEVHADRALGDRIVSHS